MDWHHLQSQRQHTESHPDTNGSSRNSNSWNRLSSVPRRTVSFNSNVRSWASLQIQFLTQGLFSLRDKKELDRSQSCLVASQPAHAHEVQKAIKNGTAAAREIHWFQLKSWQSATSWTSTSEMLRVQKIGCTTKWLIKRLDTRQAQLEASERWICDWHVWSRLLNQNKLSGNLPNLMGLSHVRVIRMEANSFTGGFYFHDPYNWQSPLGRSLEELYVCSCWEWHSSSGMKGVSCSESILSENRHCCRWVDENELHGTIGSAPLDVFSNSSIRVLRFGKQHFSGTLPSGYEGFPKLEDLWALSNWQPYNINSWNISCKGTPCALPLCIWVIWATSAVV